MGEKRALAGFIARHAVTACKRLRGLIYQDFNVPLIAFKPPPPPAPFLNERSYLKNEHSRCMN